MWENAIRAAKLDVDFYNTVERDEQFTGQAAAVVVVTSVLSAIGVWLTFRDGFFGTVLSSAIGGVVGWLIWSGIALWIGTSIFGGTADYGEMLRVIGFAHAPRAIGVIPFLGWIGAIWGLVAAVIAIREGMDFDTGKAIGTMIIGWLVSLLAVWIWGAIF